SLFIRLPIRARPLLHASRATSSARNGTPGHRGADRICVHREAISEHTNRGDLPLKPVWHWPTLVIAHACHVSQAPAPARRPRARLFRRAKADALTPCRPRAPLHGSVRAVGSVLLLICGGGRAAPDPWRSPHGGLAVAVTHVGAERLGVGAEGVALGFERFERGALALDELDERPEERADLGQRIVRLGGELGVERRPHLGAQRVDALGELLD